MDIFQRLGHISASRLAYILKKIEKIEEKGVRDILYRQPAGMNAGRELVELCWPPVGFHM